MSLGSSHLLFCKFTLVALPLNDFFPLLLNWKSLQIYIKGVTWTEPFFFFFFRNHSQTFTFRILLLSKKLVRIPKNFYFYWFYLLIVSIYTTKTNTFLKNLHIHSKIALINSSYSNTNGMFLWKITIFSRKKNQEKIFH